MFNEAGTRLSGSPYVKCSAIQKMLREQVQINVMSGLESVVLQST